MTRSASTLRVAAFAPCTLAEGPHLRAAVWVQGCTLACPGCCNPELFPRDGGDAIEVESLARALADARREHGIEGLTVLGGEPLQQTAAVAELGGRARAVGLGVIVFTGYTLAQARRRAGFDALWAVTDSLVDGPFDATRREPDPGAGGRRFVGSRNQTLHHRTARYADPALWRGGEVIELRIDAALRVSAHGRPEAVRRFVAAFRRP
jgi:anaerobic ribonucleoside-triphosphate reductase activating protein